MIYPSVARHPRPGFRNLLLAGVLLAALSLFTGPRARATAYTATNSGVANWSSATTWSPNGVPGQNDTAEIRSNATVVVDITSNCGGLTIDAGGKLENVTTAGQDSLYLYGNLVNNNPGSGGFANGGSSATKIIFAGGSVAWMGSGETSAGKFYVTVNSGVTLDISALTSPMKFKTSGTTVFTVTGTLIAGTQTISANGNANNTFVLAAGGTLQTANPNGIWASGSTSTTLIYGTAPTLDPGANYVFYGAVAQAATGLPAAANNLVISNAAGVTLGANCTVGGALTLASGPLRTTAAKLLTLGSAGSISGVSAGAFVSGPLAQIYSTPGAKTFPVGTNGNLRVVGVNLTTLTAGSSTLTVTPHEPAAFGGTAPGGLVLFTNRSWTVASSVTNGDIATLTVDGTDFAPVNSGVLADFNGSSTAPQTTTFAPPNYTAAGISLTASSDFALGDCSAPVSAPANVVATAPACGVVTVGWDAVGGAASYNLYRKLNGGAYGPPIGSSASPSCTDPAAVNGSNYVYAVAAASACGAEGPRSADSAAVAPASELVYLLSPPANAATGIGFNAAFSVSAVNAAADRWQFSADGGASWNDVTNGSGGLTAAYTTGLTTTNMNGYEYRCICFGGCSVNVTSAPATLTIQPFTQYDYVRSVWLTNLLAQASAPSSVSNTAYGYLTSMNTAAGRTNLWSDLPLGSQDNTGSGNITSTFQRLQAMALAYALPTCGYYTNAALAAAVANGMDWMTTNYYTANTAVYGNWYNWQISTPKAFDNTMVYLYPALTPAQITNYVAAMYNFGPDSVNESGYFYWGALTGANTTDSVLIMALQGALLATNSATVTRFWQNTLLHPVNPQAGYVITNGSALLWEAQGNLSGRNPQDFSGASVFANVTAGDGFYADGSFIFHGATPYTGQYGNTMLGNIADLVHLLNGSTWQITDPDLTNVFVWVTNAFEPLVYNGALMDMVRGRAISWSKATEYTEGAQVLANIAKVATFAPPALAAGMNAFVAAPQVPPGQFHFPGMDRVLALRNGFGFGLSMDSSRVATYDINTTSPSDLKGWYTGDGMTYLYLGNSDTQFTGDMWPTVDWYHLPGTTAETNATPSYSVTDQSWAGGAQVARTYGVAGMSQHSPGTTLTSKKSWFMFDNEIVCLGAGITCGDSGNAVDTTVENRRLGGSSPTNFWINGAPVPVNGSYWSSNLTSATWCALDGVGGYYFPGGASNLRASFEADSGHWTDINPSDSSSGLFTDNYLKLYFKHGVKPTNAAYAYVLLPNFTAGSVSNYAAAPDIVVLANTPAVQAASKPALGVVAANFWAAGNSADLIASSNAAAVITMESSNRLTVGIADPTQLNNNAVTVTLNRAATGVVSADAGVTVLQLAPKIVLAVDVSGALGATFQAVLALNSAPVAQNFSIAALSGVAQAVPIIGGGYAPTNAAGAPMTVTAVGSPGHGTAAVVGATNVTYTSAGGYTGPDSFSYTVSDGYGNSATQTIAVTVVPPGGRVQSVTYLAGGVTLNFVGAPGRAYTVQRAADVYFTQNVITLGTVAADGTTGGFNLTDAAPPSPAAYYRLRYP
jgi:Polysaccharide lyase family 8, super-sandwich domain/Polysaccharide lyase family 8, N terminal alpha-helical domain/Polysaccharide lyase family 8, C-terminal beta-sandwich domain/Bacterial Ig domain